MIQKLITSALASIILIIFLGIPAILQQPDNYDRSVLDFFLIMLPYTLTGYLFLGIPISYLLDWVNKKILISNKFTRYVLNLALYTVLGVLAMLVFIIIISKGDIHISDNLHTLFLGGIASLVFYHISLVLQSK